MGLFAALSFGAPWILAALVVLPALWWLLKVTPPQPRRILFPPIRLLLGLKDEEQTPAQRRLAHGESLGVITGAVPALEPLRARKLDHDDPLGGRPLALGHLALGSPDDVPSAVLGDGCGRQFPVALALSGV